MERDWDDDEERRRREQEALGGLLGADPGGVTPPSGAPPTGAPPPTSNTMPVPRTPPSAASSSANAPRLTQANGRWTLNEHGNQRQLQANEVADAQKYVDDFWTQFPTGFQPNNPNSLNDAYRQFTGRDADAAGLAAHAQNPGGFAGAIKTIAGSDEAKAYANRPASVTPPAALPTTTAAGAFRWNPGHNFSAFDTQRAQDTGKSAKDAFAHLANNAPPPPLNDKAALGAWFTQYIQPGMDALGHKVQSVDGDKFRFNNWQGTFDVDFGENAGGQGGRLQWGADAADDATRAMYAPGGVAPSAPGTKPQGSLDIQTGAPLGQGPGGPQQGGDDPLASVLAEIEALMRGDGSTPMEQAELLKLLGGAS